MRILYDGYIYKLQKAGGIGRYFNNIIRRLPNDFTPILTTYNSKSNIELPEHPSIEINNYKPFRPTRLSNAAEKYYFRFAEKSAHYDIVHPTYYTLLSQNNLSSIKKPIIITIHDMIMELFQDKINNSDDHIKWKADAIRHANSIICVSENTKTDLLKFFPQVEDKISVIYEGSEVSYNDSLGNEPVPKEPYFLYVGSRAVYKNFHLLLQAFPKVLGVKKNLKLGIVGSPLSTEEKKLIGELGINENIEYFGYVSSQHLAKLYRCSIALVYPSLYEGFGLPPLEAMTCGTAVIAANISSVPEIVGDAGLLIDPYSETELIDSMLSLLQDSSAREKLIQNGISRAKNFSWDDNVNKIVDLYRLYSK